MQETKKKIYFLPYKVSKRKIVEDKAPYVVVDTEFGYMSFGIHAIRQLGMENKFIKLYYEPSRKIIGWQIKSKLEQGELMSKSWKLVKLSKINQFRFNIIGILKQFNNLQPAYRPEIKKYIDTDRMAENSIYYFVELDKESSYEKSHKRNGKNASTLPVSSGAEEQESSNC